MHCHDSWWSMKWSPGIFKMCTKLPKKPKNNFRSLVSTYFLQWWRLNYIVRKPILFTLNFFELIYPKSVLWGNAIQFEPKMDESLCLCLDNTKMNEIIIRKYHSLRLLDKFVDSPRYPLPCPTFEATLLFLRLETDEDACGITAFTLHHSITASQNVVEVLQWAWYAPTNQGFDTIAFPVLVRQVNLENTIIISKSADNHIFPLIVLNFHSYSKLALHSVFWSETSFGKKFHMLGTEFFQGKLLCLTILSVQIPSWNLPVL